MRSMCQLETSNQRMSFLAVLGSLAAILVGGNGASGLIRLFLGAALVLFFPGYALLSAIWPRKKQLTIIERSVLSFGLSMAIVPLLLYPLSFTPWGIQLYSVSLTILCFIITMLVAAFYRQKKIPPRERATLSMSFLRPKWNEIPSLDRFFLFSSIIVAIFTIALLSGFYGSSQGSTTTEFYVLGPDDQAKGYQTVIEGGTLDLVIGVRNHEQEQLVYSVHIDVDGQNAMIVGPLLVGPGKTWEQRLRIPILARSGRRMVELRLMREGMKHTYRGLYFWMDVE